MNEIIGEDERSALVQESGSLKDLLNPLSSAQESRERLRNEKEELKN
jgi:hypothetical protein